MGLDLVLRGGRVIDPSQGIDAVMDVGFEGGRVAKIGEDLAGSDIRDVSGHIVTPGLIDLHTHVYWGGTSLGRRSSPARPRRLHDAGRHRERGTRQLSGVPRAM